MTSAERAERYPIGCRVVCTQRYREQYATLSNREVVGRVVGYGRSEDLIRVLKDGQKHPQTYHVHLWDVVV